MNQNKIYNDNKTIRSFSKKIIEFEERLMRKADIDSFNEYTEPKEWK